MVTMDKMRKEKVPSPQKTQFVRFPSSSGRQVRACGCVHRFQPLGSEDKSALTVYQRRSRSCASSQKNEDTQSVKSVLKKEETQQENNLHQEQVIEIREVIELASHSCHHQNSGKPCIHADVTPNRYATTVFVDLNSSAKHFIEEVSLQVCPSSTHPDCKSIYRATMETTIKQVIANSANRIKKVVIHCGDLADEDRMRIPI